MIHEPCTAWIWEPAQYRRLHLDADDRIRPVAFIGEDLVYGVAHTSDMDTQPRGSELFPCIA